MGLAAGTHLGPYEIVALVGEGGMGQVYKARDPRLGRDVAVKVLAAEFAADPDPSAGSGSSRARSRDDRLRRFEQEARAASALNHPNILVVHDIGSHDGAPYLVSELLEGESLRSRLQAGPLPPRRVVELAVQVCSGLAAAHEKGIVHRDLKPENLFITSDGHVKILDFGLAKLRPAPQEAGAAPTVADTTQPGMVIGTVAYMSPEQVRGQTVDHRSDLFSLGCVLYEMLSGQRAFARGTAADTMSAILKDEPPEVTTVQPGVPPPLAHVVGHCLEKQPGERFQSARDLAFDLSSLSGISGPQRAPLESARWPAWRRWLALGAGVAALLGLLVLAVALGRRTATPAVPSYSRITFRQGSVTSARFAGDGATIVYAAQWEDGKQRLHLKRPEALEALPLELPGVNAFALSKRGEVALVLRSGSLLPGVLARAPLSGGTPREIVASVITADWAPDGTDLTIVRDVEGRRRLEFPPGKVLFETAGTVSSPRFSPNGALIAFAHHPYRGDDRGSVAVVDRSGRSKTLTGQWASIQGVAWSPTGDEIWFAASTTGTGRALYAVTTAGRLRILARAPGDLVLCDVSPAGRAVVAREDLRWGILAGVGGEEKERDLTWLGGSVPRDISADGKLLLFMEQMLGSEYAVCLRRMDGSPPVELGKGQAWALSPDGTWVLASLPSPEAPLLLLPTGPGDVRGIRLPGGISHRNAVFFPDGRSILFEGYEAGHSPRLYQVGLDGGLPRAVTPEGLFTFGYASLEISPDGTWIAVGEVPAAEAGTGVWLYPMAGGARRRLPGVTKPAFPIRWSTDGRALFVAEGPEPVTIVRIDLASGQRSVVRELVPADPLARVTPYVVITPDGNSYAYAYRRRLSELYLVEGLR